MERKTIFKVDLWTRFKTSKFPYPQMILTIVFARKGPIGEYIHTQAHTHAHLHFQRPENQENYWCKFLSNYIPGECWYSILKTMRWVRYSKFCLTQSFPSIQGLNRLEDLNRLDDIGWGNLLYSFYQSEC